MNNFNRPLLKWFGEQKRVLPWRQTNDPYKIWISEIMLQQTQVATVIDYYNKFIELMPTVNDLASIDLDVLLKVWEGLGYYSRARNLQKAAFIVVNQYNSVFPTQYDDLLNLPGIGPYTAGAIMSIAYNQPYPAIDGNVYRVIARYKGIKKSIKDKEVKKEIRIFVEKNMVKDNSSDYTESLMELGALICKPSSPSCEICPLRSTCKAYKKNLTSIIPVKQIRPKKKKQHITIIVLVHNEKIGIFKRDQALLKNLYTFDTHESRFDVNQISDLYKEYSIKKIESLEVYKHIFTHLEWNIESYLVETKEPVKNFKYVDLESLEKVYSLPKAYKKLMESIKKFIS